MKLLYIIILIFLFSCGEDFLETNPTGILSDNILMNTKGIDQLLIGAYSMIDGSEGPSTEYSWAGSVSNWIWGSLAADEATRGGNHVPLNIDPVFWFTMEPSHFYLEHKWINCYEGIARCNDVLRILNKTVNLNVEYVNSIQAQTLFLRAWYHFELKRVFNHIPYITENVNNPGKVTNQIDAWPLMENDLKIAADNLPENQGDVGRPTKYAAMVVLARVYLFQKEWKEAADVLDKIINSGKYTLMPNFHDNYKISSRNNAESIFEIQYSVNDGAEGSVNSGAGDAVNFPIQNEVMNTCCGFFQPSQNLVNSYKVDKDGLPLLNSFNDVNLKNDMGIKSDSFFIPAKDTIDPRLDWTVGRRGIPFLDWAVMRGRDWIPDQDYYGPYLYKKNMFYKSEQYTYSTTTGWYTGLNANNYRAYRYAHVILWRAECAVEMNDLELARKLVNMVRIRARDGSKVMGFCSTYRLPSEVIPKLDFSKPSANYNVQPYPSFPDQEYALKAVRMELRLEFAMEGHRFFDLVRWNIAAESINDYIEKDRLFRPKFYKTGYPKFITGKNEYWPIPQSAIDDEGSDVLNQNPGY